jgi:hypothetical protein
VHKRHGYRAEDIHQISVVAEVREVVLYAYLANLDDLVEQWVEDAC